MGEKLYVGRLIPGVSATDIRNVFSPFGAIAKVDVMVGFGFVSFEDPASAEKAISELHNRSIPELSSNLLVEIAKGIDRSQNRPSHDHGYRDRDAPKGQDAYRITVDNLVSGSTWRDLKDFARDRGVVANYADVRTVDGVTTGVLAFASPDDVDDAISKLDGQSILGQIIKVTRDLHYKPKMNGALRNDRNDRRDYGPPSDRHNYDRRDGRDGGRRDDYDRRRDDYGRGYDNRDYHRNDRDRDPRGEYRGGDSRGDYRRDSRDDYRGDYRSEPRSESRGDPRADYRDDYRSQPRSDGRGDYNDYRDRDTRGPPPPRRDYSPDRRGGFSNDSRGPPRGGGYHDRDRDDRFMGESAARGGYSDRGPVGRRSPPRGNGSGPPVCYAYQRGSCDRGDSCKFAHILTSSGHDGPRR